MSDWSKAIPWEQHQQALGQAQPSSSSKCFWPRLPLTQQWPRAAEPPLSYHTGDRGALPVSGHAPCRAERWGLAIPSKSSWWFSGHGLGTGLNAQAIGCSSGGAGGCHGKVRLHWLQKPAWSEAVRSLPSSGMSVWVKAQPCFKTVASKLAGSLGTKLTPQKYQLLQNLSQLSHLRNADFSQKFYKIIDSWNSLGWKRPSKAI